MKLRERIGTLWLLAWVGLWWCIILLAAALLTAGLVKPWEEVRSAIDLTAVEITNDIDVDAVILEVEEIPSRPDEVWC